MKKYIITLCLVVGLGTTIVGCRDYLDSDYIFDERMSIEQVFQSKDYTNEWLARGYTYLKHDYLQQVNSKKNTSFNFADDMYYGDLIVYIFGNLLIKEFVICLFSLIT